jgi:hypothetical protein
LSIIPNLCICDTLYVPKDEFLENTQLNFSYIDFNIGRYFKFSGYLIIQLDGILDYKDSVSEKDFPVPLKVFWVTDLDKISDENSYYWFIYDIGQKIREIIYFNLIDSTQKIYYFCKYYTLFYSNLEWICQPPLSSLLKNLFSSILDNLTVWEKNGHYYSIISTMFFAIELFSKNIKTLLPISEYNSFFDAQICEKNKYNLNLSDIKIITYNRK